MKITSLIHDGKQFDVYNTFDEAAQLGREIGNCEVYQITPGHWAVKSEAYDPTYNYESAEAQEPIIYGQM